MNQFSCDNFGPNHLFILSFPANKCLHLWLVDSVNVDDDRHLNMIENSFNSSAVFTDHDPDKSSRDEYSNFWIIGSVDCDFHTLFQI